MPISLDGELPEDGLAAFDDDGDDLMMVLARKTVSGGEDEAETVEEVFAQAQDAESEAEELLVDKDWRPVEVNGNVHHDALEPTVELVPVFGRNGNGHHKEVDEAQKSLFYWAEFMAAEPVKPRRRNGKTQPASMSMFEWAFEQEREAALTGAGR